MRIASISHSIVRISGLIMLILGLIIWTGNADLLVPVHILIGAVLVIALWTLCYAAVRSGVSNGLVITIVILGLVLPVWGLAQEQILPEANHWIIQVLHLLLGVAAIGMGEMLAARMKKANVKSATA